MGLTLGSCAEARPPGTGQLQRSVAIVTRVLPGNIDKIQVMSNVSTARKIGMAARIASRMAAHHAGRSRTLGAVLKGARATAVHFGRVLHQLWLEVTGFIFLGLAAIGSVALVREYSRHQTGQTGLSRVLAAIVFTLVFAWFGVTSFWRAWKKS